MAEEQVPVESKNAESDQSPPQETTKKKILDKLDKQDQQIALVTKHFATLYAADSTSLTEEKTELEMLSEKLSEATHEFGKTRIRNHAKKNKVQQPYTVDSVLQHAEQEKTRKTKEKIKDRHPLSRDHYTWPAPKHLPSWVNPPEESYEEFDPNVGLFGEELFTDSDINSSYEDSYNNYNDEQIEKREIHLEDVFTRENAVKRSVHALKHKGFHINNDILEQLESGIHKIELDGNSLEFRQANNFWYGLFYDKSSQRYNYIGIDGTFIPVDSPPNVSLYVQHRNTFFDTDRELIGNDDSVYNRVTRITDAAVTSLSSIEKGFVTVDSMQPENFYEEKIKQLSLPEYIDNIKKLSGHFATHIIRFGLVTSMSAENNVGQGTYFGSAHAVFRSGNLRSPYDLIGDSTTPIGKIYQEEGVKRDTLTKTVNLAPELVDRAYEGEDKNAPFIFYPADILPLHYAFSGHMDFNPHQTGGYANWEISSLRSGEPSSISIDEGIVFLPGGLRVDPQTGSQYTIENGKGVVNQQMVQAMRNLLSRTDQIVQDVTYQELVKEIYTREDSIKNNHSLLHEEPPYTEELQKLLSTYGFQEQIGIKKQEELIRNISLYKSQYEIYRETNGESDAISTILNGLQLLYKPAESTILSKEYWEEWFTTHEGSRPAHVVYYEGDPNVALLDFLVRHKVINSSDIESVDSYMSADYKQLKRRNEKLHIPTGVVPDIGNFSPHEFGNWMYRICEKE